MRDSHMPPIARRVASLTTPPLALLSGATPMERLLTGRELKNLRALTGLTQQEFAREIGVTRVAVARWETDARRISEPMAKLIRIKAAEHRSS